MFITPWPAGLGGLLLAISVALALTGHLTPFWSGYHLLLSLLTLLYYGVDKWSATRGWRRVPEKRLLWLDMLGGWPGGAAGQWLFHHKTRKASYQHRFWLAVAVHLTALAALCWWGPQPLMELWRSAGLK